MRAGIASISLASSCVRMRCPRECRRTCGCGGGGGGSPRPIEVHGSSRSVWRGCCGVWSPFVRLARRVRVLTSW
jgi:hypothetical protein